MDIAARPEIGSVDAAAALVAAGYAQDDKGYSFRYSRMTSSGLLLIDLLTDESGRRDGDTALPVYGLAVASQVKIDVDFDVAGVGKAAVRVPSADGAFLLRSLALEGGIGGLRFVDYASDAAALAGVVTADAGALTKWRARSGPEVTRAAQIMEPLFASSTSPGSIAAAERSRQDRDLAARVISRTITELFDFSRG